MSHFFYQVLCGFLLGIGVFAPGVSGSVIAIIMGIYDTLLEILASPLRNLKRNIKSLIPMGLGALLCLALFVLVLNFLFSEYRTATYLLFMGLIAGNLPVVLRDANADGFKKRYLVGVLLAFALAMTPAVIRTVLPVALVPRQTASLPFVGLSGAVAGVSAIVPGMSVSMILMVFGVYEQLLSAAEFSNLAVDIPTLFAAGVGFVFSMVLFSRVVRFMLKRHRPFSYFSVFGFMCGSLATIFWDLFPVERTFHWFSGVIMVVLGLGISLFFVYLGKRLKPPLTGDASGAQPPR